MHGERANPTNRGRPAEHLKNLGPDELAEHIRSQMAAAHPNDSLTAQRVARAIELAELLHRDQRRAQPTITTDDVALAGADLYVVHPLRNAMRIIRWGEADPDIVIGAVLHDTVEDQPEKLIAGGGIDSPSSPEQQRSAALDAIDDEFGSTVRDIVAAVSNPIWAPGLSADQKRQGYVDHVRKAVRGYPAFMVKVADFVDNALGLHHQVGRPDVTARLAWKYQPLCPVLLAAALQHSAAGHRLSADLMAKLERAADYLADLAPVSPAY